MKYTCAVCGGKVSLVRKEDKSKEVEFNEDGSVSIEHDAESNHELDAVCKNDESHNIGRELYREILSRSDEFVDID